MARFTFHLNKNTMNISTAAKKYGKLAQMFGYWKDGIFNYVENLTHILHSIRILTTPSLIFGRKSIYAYQIESIAPSNYFAIQFFPPLTLSLFGMNEKFNNKFENQRVVSLKMLLWLNHDIVFRSKWKFCFQIYFNRIQIEFDLFFPRRNSTHGNRKSIQLDKNIPSSTNM